MSDARRLAGEALAHALRDSRDRTRAWTFDLDDAQWRVPCRTGVNLVAWELAHLAWFGEFWTLRGPHTLDAEGRVHAARPARIAGPDALFDSARLPHAARWSVRLPTRDDLRARLAAQLDAALDTLDGLAGAENEDASLYQHRLVLFHEDMHAEAFAWLRATLGYSAPPGVKLAPVAQVSAQPAIRLDAAQFEPGRRARESGFAFDNEVAVHTVAIADFEIDPVPVTAGQFLRFVESDGYDRPEFWPGEAGRWRALHARSHPLRWRHEAGAWTARWFDRWLPLDPDLPVVHVSAWEAEAYARWANRRLPSALEWEYAATSRPDFAWGRSVWEWTSSDFASYPGFEPGPYRDYSAPWFGDHRELRGGAFVTHARMHDARYRNFFMPGRNDVFSGFRTAHP